MNRNIDITIELYDSRNGLNNVQIECDDKSSEFIVTADFSFNTMYNDVPIRDIYSLKMLLPYSYPAKYPKVFETGGRIPLNDDNHANKDDNGSLCLGTNAEIFKILKNDSSLSYFINAIMLPFFYAASYKEQKGEYPWRTRPHGWSGIVDEYVEFFGLVDAPTAVKFFINLRSYRHPPKGRVRCPCGSGKRFRDCHEEKYSERLTFYSHEQTLSDIENVISAITPKKS